MARIRALKIGFFRNEQLAEFSPWHRLLFAGLWVLADKAGRLEDRAKRIKAELFPYDRVNVEDMLNDLCAGADPFLIRYEANGLKLIAIANFSKHQRPHHTEQESEYLGPNSKNTVKTPLLSREEPDEHGATTSGVGVGVGVGNGVGVSSTTQDVGEPTFLTYPILHSTREWVLTEAAVKDYETAYPSLDVRRELQRAQFWARTNPKKRKSHDGMPRFLGNWLNGALRDQGTAGKPQRAVPDADATLALIRGGAR